MNSLRHPRYPDDLVTFDVRGKIVKTRLVTLRRFPVQNGGMGTTKAKLGASRCQRATGFLHRL